MLIDQGSPSCPWSDLRDGVTRTQGPDTFMNVSVETGRH